MSPERERLRARLGGVRAANIVVNAKTNAPFIPRVDFLSLLRERLRVDAVDFLSLLRERLRVVDFLSLLRERSRADVALNTYTNYKTCQPN